LRREEKRESGWWTGGVENGEERGYIGCGEGTEEEVDVYVDRPARRVADAGWSGNCFLEGGAGWVVGFEH
jgi:hypothetical protein